MILGLTLTLLYKQKAEEQARNKETLDISSKGNLGIEKRTEKCEGNSCKRKEIRVKRKPETEWNGKPSDKMNYSGKKGIDIG